MALNLGVISAEIRLEFGRFVDGVRTARSAMQNAFGSSTQSSINNTTRTVDNLGTHLKSIERIVGGILVSQGFYRMFNDIQKANGAMLDFMNNIQKSQIAMQYFLGNAKDANAFIMNMEDFAAKTSFSTEQAMTLSRRLMAAQFDPAKVKSVMEVLNDSASATGATAEQMDRIVLALTQMRTNGKIAGQEMRQLAEAGIPIYQILNEELGVTKKQLMNIGKLHIDGDIGVQAVLNGLEKRYKGAAIAIANTLPGMWETITDDMKMIGNDIFMYPYKAFEGGMRKIRDAMEKARYNVFMTGAGGLFENMFSPKTQANLRTILASIRSLVQSVSYLASALKPVVGIIGTAFTEVISKAILPLAALARVVVIVAVVALKVITPLRYLLASIGGFIIATVAAKALMILWRVTGLGMIASVVASAVRALTTAIKWLIFAIVDNPIILFFIALAGVAGYFASKLDIVHKALGSVKNGLTSLIGVDPTKIFTPKIKEANDSTDKFNDSVVTTDDNLKKVGASLDNTGKNAAKAGKKVKDSFIQSFDEVFTIPDKVDKVADTLNGVGSIPFDDNLNIPDLGKGGPGGSGIKLPKLDLPNLFPSADDLWAGLGKSLKGMWKSAVKWFKSINSYDIFGWAFTFGSWIDKYLVQPISKWAKDSTDAIAGWVHDAGVSFSNWCTKVAKTFVGWIASTFKMFADWRTNTAKHIIGFVIDTGKAIGGWISKQAKAFGDWVTDRVKQFGNWYTKTKKSVTDWASETGRSISTWVTNHGKSLAGWVTNRVSQFSSWYSKTKKNVTDWASETGPKIKTWVTDHGKSLAGWVTNRVSQFSSWYSKTKKNVTDWASETGPKIKTWVTDHGKSLAGWVTNRTKQFSQWYTNTKKNVTDWASETGKSISTWVTNRGKDIGTWATNIGGKIASGFTNAKTAIVKAFSGFWTDGIKPPLNAAIKGVNSFIDKFNGMKIKIPKVDIPGIGSWGGGSIGLPNLGHIPELATGGIVLKDQLIRAGEKNKREAVVPLENPAYMKPFSDAVASQLASSFSGERSTSSVNNVTNLNVGVLIGDERSYRELERKLKSIRQTESTRGGGSLSWQRV